MKARLTYTNGEIEDIEHGYDGLGLLAFSALIEQTYGKKPKTVRGRFPNAYTVQITFQDGTKLEVDSFDFHQILEPYIKPLSKRLSLTEVVLLKIINWVNEKF